MTKESSSSDIRDYRPVYIKSILSKVFEKFMAVKLSHFLEGSSLLPPSQFSHRRDLGT